MVLHYSPEILEKNVLVTESIQIVEETLFLYVVMNVIIFYVV